MSVHILQNVFNNNYKYPGPPIDCIRAMMLFWKLKEKIIRTVLCILRMTPMHEHLSTVLQLTASVKFHIFLLFNLDFIFVYCCCSLALIASSNYMVLVLCS